MFDFKEHTVEKKIRTQAYNTGSRRSEMILKDKSVEKLLSEGGDEFARYVRSTGVAMDADLIVLPSFHHYYYDSEELKNVKSIVVLKKLNRIEEIENFLDTHLDFLPDDCSFIGCFINNSKIDQFALRTGTTRAEKLRNSDKLELGIVSRYPFLNMVYSLMDLRTNSYMSEKSVNMMLSDHGFEVTDMTESNDLTFFNSRKFGSQLRKNQYQQ